MTDKIDPNLQCISEVKKVTTEAQVNKYLGEGWVLLGVFDRRDGSDQYVEYILGYPEEPASPSFG